MWRAELQELREEFRLIQFRLMHSNAGDFAETPWFGVPLILIYRVLVALYCIVWIILSGFHPWNNHEKWFIYLTNWSFLFVTSYFILSSLLTAFYYKAECKQGEYEMGSPEPIPLKHRYGLSRSSDIDSREKSREEIRGSRDKTESRGAARDIEQSRSEIKASINPLEVGEEIPMSWYHEGLWVIYNIAANTALLITVTNRDYAATESPKNDGLIITTQVLNTVFILLETLLGTVPVQLLHVIYPMLFSVVYIMFTVVYWATKGNNSIGQPFIYSILDYSGNPQRSIATVLGFFFIGHPVAQLALFIIYRIRCLLSRKFSKKLVW